MRFDKEHRMTESLMLPSVATHDVQVLDRAESLDLSTFGFGQVQAWFHEVWPSWLTINLSKERGKAPWFSWQSLYFCVNLVDPRCIMKLNPLLSASNRNSDWMPNQFIDNLIPCFYQAHRLRWLLDMVTPYLGQPMTNCWDQAESCGLLPHFG